MNNTTKFKQVIKPRQVLSFHEIGTRTEQEDAYLVCDDNSLFVVCDGVGGSSNGRYTSSKIIELIGKLYNECIIKDPEEIIKYLINESNKVLVTHQHASNTLGGSTTIALVLLLNDTAYVTNIGDSRIYFISNRENTYWISKDHSFVQELLDAGIIESEQEMKSHPLKSRITKAISDDNVIETNEILIKKLTEIHKGDIFLLCTDGVIEKMLSDDLISIFNNGGMSFEASFRQLNEFCKMYSKDNSTAIGIIF